MTFSNDIDDTTFHPHLYNSIYFFPFFPYYNKKVCHLCHRGARSELGFKLFGVVTE